MNKPTELENLNERRQQLLKKIGKKTSILFQLQNELLNIEHSIINRDHKEIMDSLTLNEQQLKIINSKNKYTLVIACPGSGKTHTLISLYIKMIVDGIDFMHEALADPKKRIIVAEKYMHFYDYDEPKD
jgi:ATP-dependent exoDNAse (exonuclease V) beta subunit